MSRIKTRQKSFYTDVDTPPPIFLPNRSKRNAPDDFGQSSQIKRYRYEEASSDLDQFFFLSMRNRLKELPKTSLNKKKKKANGTVDELKNCLLQAKKLPTGIITSAAGLTGCYTRQMRDFIENRPGMTNIEEWKVVVDKHFDETLESLTNRLDSMMISPSSTTTNTVEEE
ncbi:hypothetical protein RMATCC62417_13632 [Rhizopus microsporus]|nr:hypothetical protein RMATCC62417_13632 [Rhizopus microsporus]